MTLNVLEAARVSAVSAHGSARSRCFVVSDMCLIKMWSDHPNLTESAMPRTRHQSQSTPSQPSCLPGDPSIAINQSHSAVAAKQSHSAEAAKSRVGNKIVSNTKQQTQKKTDDVERRRSQRPTTQRNAAAAAVSQKEVAEKQAQMFAQYRERKAREEARLNAQHVGMLRYLRLCL